MKLRSAFFVFTTVGISLAISSFTGSGNAQLNEKGQLFFTRDTSESRKVSVNEQYSMIIPNHLKESKELNDEASLQYADPEAELYIIVIDEPTKDFISTYKQINDWDASMSTLENYRRVQIASMKKKMKFKGKPVIQKTKAGSTSMEIVDFNGKVKGIKSLISYKTGFIESNGFLYLIMSWTIADMKNMHNAEMEEMVKSFRAIN
jgi:hypothetical protein